MMPRRGINWTLWLSLGFLGWLYWWTFTGLESSDVNIWDRLKQGARILELMFVEVDLHYYPTVVSGVIESVQMAIIATTMAAVLAIPFGFWAARNLTRLVWLPLAGKVSLNFIRTFPELLLAIIFFRGVGPGAFAGILAMGVHSIGMLGKLYGEVVESIDRGPVEALEASGANRLQVIWYAIMPQVLPEFASYAIYRFEINVRAATVLGVVGAGGIGKPLIFNLLSRDWEKVGLILIGIIVVVSVIDYLSSWVRSKLV